MNNKLLFSILGILVATGIVGGITTYAMVASLQTEVENLKKLSERSESEIHRQIEKDKVHREKIKHIDKQWLEHDRWIHSFHGKDIVKRKPNG